MLIGIGTTYSQQTKTNDPAPQMQAPTHDSNTAKSAPTQALPAGFPKYVDTGDPVADRARYSAAKDEWILLHPEAYAKMQAKPGKQQLRRSDFDKLPAHRKQQILDRPNDFEVIED